MRAGILKQEVHMRRMEHEPRPRVNIVTDAATSIGMAAMWMDRDGNLVRKWHERHDGTVRRYAVHVELQAIAECVEQTTDTGVVIRLGSDCLGAIQAIKKGWSKSAAMLPLIIRIYTALEAKDNKLSMVHVPGKDNFADFHSRFYSADGAKPKEFPTNEMFVAEDERRRLATWDVLRGTAETKWEGRNKGW